ncbi:hypothetical protein P3X46_027641 [Hevea brasiliensis]|uniref:Bifunctional inhibitor/plant lipid transfer protein/seed storage helical domain-containing protein n=1 Tax=Hevea brasiliensis TaxID=3981 RepID=A0ABQ9L264_HEVBR|nr:non-specific lipid transfer protein GPI-anchored 5 [Hevea brasiliensis]KAJ9154288.1 hypothetical protein P3X46_027641 [Hevea brasiliensis]
MQHREMAMNLALILVGMLWARAMAQSSCSSVIISMSPCLNYVTGNSLTPSLQCCTQLSIVVHSSPQCLCEVINGGGSSLGININRTQALTLPGACNVQTPPISRCYATSPAAFPTGTPEVPGTPSGTGSKTAPSEKNGPGKSSGSPIKLSISLLAFALFAASYVSTFMTY